ncbi:MAG: hypothetical protein U1E56_04155 [Bauldia sp.]
MRRFFGLYEWVGPLLLTPLAIWLWLLASRGNWAVSAIGLAIPVLHGYVVPGVGCALLRVWSFTARRGGGGFLPQHGFLFGSATSATAAVLFLLSGGAPSAVRATLVASVLLAINWAVDALAIRHGALIVRNQRWADGASAWAIAGDYVVWFFGLSGLAYAAIMLAVLAASPPASGGGDILAWTLHGLLTTTVPPTLAYIASSWLQHGHSGCRPIAPRGAE